MVTVDQLTEAALKRDNFTLRKLVQDFLREAKPLRDYPRPHTDDPVAMAIAAGLLELLALRVRQQPPVWTSEVGPSPKPIFLITAAESMKRLRKLCETESPEPLRRRLLYAPPNFLEFV